MSKDKAEQKSFSQKGLEQTKEQVKDTLKDGTIDQEKEKNSKS